LSCNFGSRDDLITKFWFSWQGLAFRKGGRGPCFCLVGPSSLWSGQIGQELELMALLSLQCVGCKSKRCAWWWVRSLVRPSVLMLNVDALPLGIFPRGLATSGLLPENRLICFRFGFIFGVKRLGAILTLSYKLQFAV